MDEQTNRPKPICPFKFVGGGGGGGGVWLGMGGQTNRPKPICTFNFVGGEGGTGKWMDRRTGPNQFAPSTLSGEGVNGWTDKQAQTNLPLQLCRGGGGHGLGWEWVDRQTGPNQFAPSTLSGGRGARVGLGMGGQTNRPKPICPFNFVGGEGGTGKLMDRRTGPNQFAPSTLSGGGGKWMDRQTGPNQFAPSTLSGGMGGGLLRIQMESKNR